MTTSESRLREGTWKPEKPDRGKGEIREDANAGAPRRSATLPASASGRSFPVISDDRRSRRKAA